METIFETKATVASPVIGGEADIAVTEDELTLTTLFDTAAVAWADVAALAFADYAVTVRTLGGDAYTLTKLGADGEPLYHHMLSAYGDKVRKAFFVSGEAALKTKGDVHDRRGVPIEVYNNCILSLPPDLNARRLPLCFLTGFAEEDFTVKATVLDGSVTTYAKLGYDHAPFVKAVSDAVKALREKTVEQILEIDPSLSGAQSAQLARLVPEGAAAPMGALAAIAPSFAAALEAKLAESRAAETYEAFKAMSGAENICVGFRKKGGRQDATPTGGIADAIGGLMGGDGGGIADALGGLLGGDGGGIADVVGGKFGSGRPETAAPAGDAYDLWLIAPAPSGDACAVEFAGAPGEAAATFVYRFAVPWDSFRVRLNMALEAIAFKREVIRLTEDELAKPEYALYRMAAARNDALQLVRAGFVGRAIHSSMEAWARQLSELFAG
ncbi:MAG: hypothetical protein LBR00_06090 [Clostridiales Family XIII bacterium]|nr:hypothetical protein [Clostridiales Family XIII bacterium]